MTTKTPARRSRLPLALKERFVELRAQGEPLSRCVNALKVGKSTLVEWNKELKEDIATARAVELEALREKFYLSTERRVALFGAEVERMKKELARRDYRNVSTEKLVELLMKVHEALRAEDVEPVFKTEAEKEQDRAAELILLRLPAGAAPRREPEGTM